MLETDSEVAVLGFWFGGAPDDAVAAREQAALWWGKSEQTDALITQRYAGLLEQARAGALDAWAQTPRGRLALIILTDQFPRNIHRDTPLAFASDALARQHCKDGLARGDDLALRPIERVFFYLPLEHAEDAADQAQSVELFTRLVEDVPADQRALFAGFLDYARRHQAIIDRFGRFPHRNAILARVSTAAELAFLQTPGSSF